MMNFEELKIKEGYVNREYIFMSRFQSKFEVQFGAWQEGLVLIAIDVVELRGWFSFQLVLQNLEIGVSFSYS